MERQPIAGIAADKNEARVTLTGVADRPGTVAQIFGPLAEAGITVDMIVQNVDARHRIDRPDLHRPAREPVAGAGGDRAAPRNDRLCRR